MILKSHQPVRISLKQTHLNKTNGRRELAGEEGSKTEKVSHD